MENSILASAGRPLWRYLEANKIDADSMFKRFGLDPSRIQEPRSRYPYQLLCDAWVEAAAITQNEHIGFDSAKHYTPLDLNALGVTFLSSTTLTEAFQRLVRYESVLNSHLTFSIIESTDRVDLISELAEIPIDAIRIVEDCRTSVLVNLCRLGLDMALDPVEVAFTYPEPKATGEHFAIFRCPVKFSQPASRVSFNLADTRRPFTSANRELALSSDQILEFMIKDLNQSDLISQVKRAIIDDLPSGAPSATDIAKCVFVSNRTLQRRLSDENTNFQTLLLEVRRELAKKYLEDRSMPLAEISYMLGFADASSFSRAFKQWTGDPPAAFRTNLLA